MNDVLAIACCVLVGLFGAVATCSNLGKDSNGWH